MRTRIKICGITIPEDAVLAAQLGADAIGLIFYEQSPRGLSIGEAQDIINVIPPFITIVGLFVNPSPKHVAAVLHRVPLDILQFHGDEPPEECNCYGKPYIKAIPMRRNVNLIEEVKRYSTARALLLDSYNHKLAGGTGEKFDWALIPKDIGKYFILAGGLTPDNVWQVITSIRPYAVDVSSGVEIEKGLKDPEKMAAFIRGVNGV